MRAEPYCSTSASAAINDACTGGRREAENVITQPDIGAESAQLEPSDRSVLLRNLEAPGQIVPRIEPHLERRVADLRARHQREHMRRASCDVLRAVQRRLEALGRVADELRLEVDTAARAL